MSLLLAIALAAVQDRQPETVVDAVAKCREIADAEERLQCFDRATNALVEAQEAEEVVVIDRNVAEQAEREAFGSREAAVPRQARNLGAERINSVNATITEVASIGYEKWAFRLSDGSVWEMIESTPRLRIDEGDSIRIERAALGSFRASIDGSKLVRIRRNR